MKAPEAFVPAEVRGMFDARAMRLVIRMGMRCRRSSRFSAFYVHRHNGAVIATEENDWLDLGGEAG